MNLKTRRCHYFILTTKPFYNYLHKIQVIKLQVNIEPLDWYSWTTTKMQNMNSSRFMTSISVNFCTFLLQHFTFLQESSIGIGILSHITNHDWSIEYRFFPLPQKALVSVWLIANKELPLRLLFVFKRKHCEETDCHFWLFFFFRNWIFESLYFRASVENGNLFND